MSPDEAPAYTGICVRPIAVRIEVALYVVWGSEELPWTVEIPRRVRDGW